MVTLIAQWKNSLPRTFLTRTRAEGSLRREEGDAGSPMKEVLEAHQAGGASCLQGQEWQSVEMFLVKLANRTC